MDKGKLSRSRRFGEGARQGTSEDVFPGNWSVRFNLAAILEPVLCCLFLSVMSASLPERGELYQAPPALQLFSKISVDVNFL